MEQTSARRPPLVAAFALILFGLGSTVLSAKTIEYKLDPALYGHLDQHDIDCKLVGCGPAAAANSFLFLQQNNSDLYKGGNTLVPKKSGAFDLVGVANELGGLMGCDASCSKGTLIEDFILGKIAYFDKHAPGTTKVEAEMNFAWRSAKPKPGGVSDGTKPTLGWLADQLKNKQDVELFVGSSDDKVQHYITLTGISFDDMTSKGSMWIVDPWDGKEHKIGIDGLTGGYIDTDYTVNGKAADFVYHAVAESPVPEPATWLLLVAGTSVLVFRRRRPE
jgi:hypothetical protein